MRVAESETQIVRIPISALLQWSRNLRVAESNSDPQAVHKVDRASMEPQLEGCGKPAWPCAEPVHSVLQWSRNLRVAESDTLEKNLRRMYELQWSRNLRVAERRWRPMRRGTVLALQWSRNLRVAERLTLAACLAG